MKKVLKTLTVLMVIAIMALGVFGLAACDLGFDLDAHKATAVTAIENHAAIMKDENGYTTQGLADIEQAVVDGKEAVKNATTRASVTTERDKAIQAIDEVQKEDEMVEIVSINFVITQSFKGYQDIKFYDFAEMKYLAKRVDADGECGKEIPYDILATFTDEQIEVFFKSIREIGIFDLDKNYDDSEILDGWDWQLVIVLSDGNTFESRGYAQLPEQAEAIDKAFFALTGYNLFALIY